MKGLGTNTTEEMHLVQPVNNVKAPISKHHTTTFTRRTLQRRVVSVPVHMSKKK